MHLVNLGQYRSQKISKLLDSLQTLALTGDISGLVFVAKFGHYDHRAGRAGDYTNNPQEALIATYMLEQQLIAQTQRDIG